MPTTAHRGGFVVLAVLLGFAPSATVLAGDTPFRRHDINPESTYSACAAFDVNHDSKLDIVCGGFWYEAPTWKRHFVRDVPVIRGRFDGFSHLPMDVNGDGWLDIVSANYRSAKIEWIEHPGKGLGPWVAHDIASPGPMETGRLVDVDGDGRLDVLPNGVKFAAWWELVHEKSAAGGTVPRWVQHDLPTDVAGHGVGFGDVNGDGGGDVVGPRGWLEAPEDRRHGRWTWHPDFELHRDSSIPILVFDVDGDGDNDIVWGRGHNIGLYWLEQVPNSSWIKHAIDTSASQFHSPLLADLDGDGTVEVIAGKRYMGHEGRDPGEWDALVIYSYQFNRASRTWQRRVVSPPGPVGFGLDPKVIDLDGDGDLDLVCPGRSGLYWLENLRIPGDAALTAPPPPAPTYTDHSKLLVYKDAKGADQAVTDHAQWAIRRAHILANMERVMGELPDPSRRVPLDVKIEAETDTPQYVRRTISFAPEPGDRVPAYLLVPKNLSGNAPAMLCLHQTTKIGKGEPAGLGGLPTLHYAHELANRGYVCLVPDYPSFGDYPFDFAAYRDRYPSGTMKAIWNNIRAVDLLESLPEVDPDKIGCIGHSLGGHNSMYTAAFDQRLRVIVSSCGFNAFHHYYGGKLAGWTSDRYMPRIRDLYENNPDKMPFDFHEVVAAFAPRPFFSNSPLHDSNFEVAGVREAIDSAAQVYELLGVKDRITPVYPDCEHDFPDAVRQQAYEWLDRWLK